MIVTLIVIRTIAMNDRKVKNYFAAESKIISKIISTEKLSNEIETLDGMFAYKTVNHEIVTCNQVYLNYIGFKKVNRLAGKTDFDLIWQDYTHIYHAQEDDALQGKIYTALHPAQDVNERKFVAFNRKYPWCDEKGNIIGIVSHSIEVDNPNFIEVVNLLNKTTICEPEKDHLLCERVSEFKLTPREGECLFYLLHGKTGKQIARIMAISHRTVETYIDALKFKFNCHTKSDLIDFCIRNGLIKIVPTSVFSKKLLTSLEE
jgi:DNA-binding CsgD family transcriptional regulator